MSRGVFQRTRDLRTRLLALSVIARQGASKADFLISKIETRKKYLRAKTKYADESQKEFVKREIESLTRIQQRLAYVQVILEMIALRAETAAIAGSILSTIAVIRELLKQIRKRGFVALPGISLVLEEIYEATGEVLAEAMNIEYNDSPVLAKAEAEKILEEAEVIAKERLAGKFNI